MKPWQIMQIYTLTNDMKLHVHTTLPYTRIHTHTHTCINKTYMNVLSVTDPCLYETMFVCICMCMNTSLYIYVCVCVCFTVCAQAPTCVFSTTTPLQCSNSVSSGLSDINGQLLLLMHHPPAGKIGPRGGTSAHRADPPLWSPSPPPRPLWSVGFQSRCCSHEGSTMREKRQMEKQKKSAIQISLAVRGCGS